MLEKYCYSRVVSRQRIPELIKGPATIAEESKPDIPRLRSLIEQRFRPPLVTTAANYPVVATVQPVIILD